MNLSSTPYPLTEINRSTSSFSLMTQLILSVAPKTRRLGRENSALRPTPPTSMSTSFLTSSSSCSKLILLSEWWLIKSETEVEGKKLAVAGYHYSREETTTHVFTSAPIVKRLNFYTLETADGFTLRLVDGINLSHSWLNGFPPEVSHCFFIGFPYNWEYYAKKDFGPIILSSASFPSSSVNSNEGIFPIHVAGEFSLFKLLNDCASNPESSLDDLLIKNFTSSPVNAELHIQSNTSNDSVRRETISRPEKDNNDEERRIQHECHELHDGVSCEHLISSLFNVNCENQNETKPMLHIESLSNKGSEINNEKLSFENTFDSINSTDDFLNASSPEDLKSLHTQQEDNSVNKDPEFITRKMGSALEASFESPYVCAQRNTDTESNPHSGVKVSSTTLSPFASSLLSHMRIRKLGCSKLNMHNRAKRIRVNSPNDDSDVVESTFNNNILSLNVKESKANDTTTLNTNNASPVEKDNSDCNLGRAQRCYTLRSRDAKIEYNSPNSEENLESKPLNPSKLDYTESQNATCVDNSATLTNNSTGILKDSSSTKVDDMYLGINIKPDYINGKRDKFDYVLSGKSPLIETVVCNSNYNTGDRATSTYLKDKCEGGRIMENVMEVECEGTYNADDTSMHANDLGDIEQCINRISTIHKDVLITQTKEFSKCGSDYSEMHSTTRSENQDDIKSTIRSEEIEGITSNQDENQTEVIQEAQVNKFKSKKARNQKRVQRPNISEEMNSPWTRGKIKKLNGTLSTSPELLNPKWSRSGRLLLPPINRWQREIIYDMDGSITTVADVDKLTSIAESKSIQSGSK